VPGFGRAGLGGAGRSPTEDALDGTGSCHCDIEVAVFVDIGDGNAVDGDAGPLV